LLPSSLAEAISFNMTIEETKMGMNLASALSSPVTQAQTTEAAQEGATNAKTGGLTALW
jgi:hypothetical protein